MCTTNNYKRRTSGQNHVSIIQKCAYHWNYLSSLLCYTVSNDWTNPHSWRLTTLLSASFQIDYLKRRSIISTAVCDTIRLFTNSYGILAIDLRSKDVSLVCRERFASSSSMRGYISPSTLWSALQNVENSWTDLCCANELVLGKLLVVVRVQLGHDFLGVLFRFHLRLRIVTRLVNSL